MPRPFSAITSDCHCEVCHTDAVRNGMYCECRSFQEQHPEHYQMCHDANELYDTTIRTRTENPFEGYIEDCECVWCRAWRAYVDNTSFEENFTSFVSCNYNPHMTCEDQVQNLCRLCNVFHADKGRVGLSAREYHICGRCYRLDQVVWCPDCGRYGHWRNREVSDIEFPYANGDGFRESSPCEECADNYEVTSCCQCDATLILDVSEYEECDDDFYCENCACDWLVACANCSERCNTDYVIHIHDLGSVCEGCAENYSFCDDCEVYYDDDCRCADGVIRNYSHRPPPIFLYDTKIEHADNTVFFGVELEFENFGSLSHGKAALNVRDAFHEAVCDEDPTFNWCDDLLYFKRDSTIHNGFELVSHPFSWAFLKRHKAAFEALFEAVNSCRLKRADNCGMHVHISKEPFSRIETYKLARFLFGNPFFTERMSNRREDRFRSQANVYGESKKELLQKSRTKSGGGRNCLNLNPATTMELRMFDSVDTFDDFMRHMEFVEALCRFVRITSMKSLWPNLLMDYVSKNRKTFPRVHRFFQNTLF